MLIRTLRSINAQTHIHVYTLYRRTYPLTFNLQIQLIHMHTKTYINNCIYSNAHKDVCIRTHCVHTFMYKITYTNIIHSLSTHKHNRTRSHTHTHMHTHTLIQALMQTLTYI